MKTATRFRRAIRRVKTLWAELDYAQRRLFEIRTGVDVDNHRRRSQAELDALYAVPPSKRPLTR